MVHRSVSDRNGGAAPPVPSTHAHGERQHHQPVRFEQQSTRLTMVAAVTPTPTTSTTTGPPSTAVSTAATSPCLYTRNNTAGGESCFSFDGSADATPTAGAAAATTAQNLTVAQQQHRGDSNDGGGSLPAFTRAWAADPGAAPQPQPPSPRHVHRFESAGTMPLLVPSKRLQQYHSDGQVLPPIAAAAATSAAECPSAPPPPPSAVPSWQKDFDYFFSSPGPSSPAVGLHEPSRDVVLLAAVAAAAGAAQSGGGSDDGPLGAEEEGDGESLLLVGDDIRAPSFAAGRLLAAAVAVDSRRSQYRLCRTSSCSDSSDPSGDDSDNSSTPRHCAPSSPRPMVDVDSVDVNALCTMSERLDDIVSARSDQWTSPLLPAATAAITTAATAAPLLSVTAGATQHQHHHPHHHAHPLYDGAESTRNIPQAELAAAKVTPQKRDSGSTAAAAPPLLHQPQPSHSCAVHVGCSATLSSRKLAASTSPHNYYPKCSRGRIALQKNDDDEPQQQRRSFLRLLRALPDDQRIVTWWMCAHQLLLLAFAVAVIFFSQPYVACSGRTVSGGIGVVWVDSQASLSATIADTQQYQHYTMQADDWHFNAFTFDVEFFGFIGAFELLFSVMMFLWVICSSVSPVRDGSNCSGVRKALLSDSRAHDHDDNAQKKEEEEENNPFFDIVTAVITPSGNGGHPLCTIAIFFCFVIVPLSLIFVTFFYVTAMVEMNKTQRDLLCNRRASRALRIEDYYRVHVSAAAFVLFGAVAVGVSLWLLKKLLLVSMPLLKLITADDPCHRFGSGDEHEDASTNDVACCDSCAPCSVLRCTFSSASKLLLLPEGDSMSTTAGVSACAATTPPPPPPPHHAVVVSCCPSTPAEGGASTPKSPTPQLLAEAGGAEADASSVDDSFLEQACSNYYHDHTTNAQA